MKAADKGDFNFRRNLTLSYAKLTLTLLALTSVAAYAEGPRWSTNVQIVEMANTSDGGIDIRTSPSLVNCVSNSGYGPNFASVYPTHPAINRMKADLLLAIATGATVALYFDNDKCRIWEMRIFSKN